MNVILDECLPRRLAWRKRQPYMTKGYPPQVHPISTTAFRSCPSSTR